MFFILFLFLDKGKYWYYGCVIFFFCLYGIFGEDLYDNESDVLNCLGFLFNFEKKLGIFV